MERKTVVIYQLIASLIITLSILYFSNKSISAPQYQTVTCYSTTKVGEEGNYYEVYVCGSCTKKMVVSYSDQGTCKIKKQVNTE